MADRHKLWDAINRYAAACGGRPDKHARNNLPRMIAVNDIERAIEDEIETALDRQLDGLAEARAATTTRGGKS